MEYFSYVTLTTLGYGDITPILPAARSVTILEAILGQLYLTIVLARLVGLYLQERSIKAAPNK
jgi:voltage-gated potassium channel Kch